MKHLKQPLTSAGFSAIEEERSRRLLPWKPAMPNGVMGELAAVKWPHNNQTVTQLRVTVKHDYTGTETHC